MYYNDRMTREAQVGEHALRQIRPSELDQEGTARHISIWCDSWPMQIAPHRLPAAAARRRILSLPCLQRFPDVPRLTSKQEEVGGTVAAAGLGVGVPCWVLVLAMPKPAAMAAGI